ncbi:hypothetical protein [Alloactinosynnema sp. L-07]|uniref:hypothetical protein n=1 Tax=Alloactinosynnema sp. L-07 TaxID=1653480 RepID=UPI00065EF8C4|nr:hypothetical protein [Alloactinosynnema sp. L-07]CRK58669.1 hypothetical protein [Alloactinosynnema sp. L-07]
MKLDYGRDRHTALRLVACDRIVAVDSILRRVDGHDLQTGVFAALVVLENGGYIERRIPGKPGTRAWPVRLMLTGTGLLSRFNQHPGPVGAWPGRSPVAPTRGWTGEP